MIPASTMQDQADSLAVAPSLPSTTQFYSSATIPPTGSSKIHGELHGEMRVTDISAKIPQMTVISDSM